MANYTLADNRPHKPDDKPWDSAALGVVKGEAAPPKYNSEERIKDSLSEDSLCKFFNAMKTTASEHRAPREPIWESCWSLYNNEHDWTDRAWWQHKAPIPKVRTSVDKAVALFRKTLLRMNPFYGIQAESKLGRVKGRYTMLLTDYWFDQADIVDIMVDAFKVGLITSTSILKIWWMRTRDFKPEINTTQIEKPTFEFGVQTGSIMETVRNIGLKEFYRGRLGVAVVNPMNFWIVPGTNNRCMIERSEATLNEIESLVKSKDNPEGVYSEDAVSRLREQLYGQTISDDTTPQTTGEGVPSSNQYLRKVDLWHYWGDIFDTQGKLVKCDSSFTLANEKILIREARDNPFYHKSPPYVVGTPYKVPFSTYNRGMVEDIREIARSITNMANLIADGALFDAMKCFAIDVDQLDDPAEAKTGVYPGKSFIRKSGQAASPNEQVVQTVNVGKIPSEAMNMVGLFEKYYQEGSYMNEWVSGQGGKGDRTLGEVNIKTQSALEGLDESARNLEVTLVEPCLQMTAQVIYQFHEDYTLSRLVENYPGLSVTLQQMQPAERYFTMVGDFSFKVRGLSIMIDRQQKIGELKEVLQLLSYLPGFIERMNPDATLEEVLMPLGWDPSKLLLNPTASNVMTPMAGAAPQPPMAVPPGMPPAMARRNADEGAKMGGSINNPMGRPGSGQPGAMMPNGGAGGGTNPMASQIARMVQFAMMKQFANQAAR